MLLPLIAVLVGIAASPLTTQEVAQDARTVVDALDVNGLKVTIRRLQGSSNPSPLLVKSKGSNCTLWVNEGKMAHAMWEQFLSDHSGETEAALRDFAVAHEIGHCIAGDLRARAIDLPRLTAGDQVLLPDGPLAEHVTLTHRVTLNTTPTEAGNGTVANSAPAALAAAPTGQPVTPRTAMAKKSVNSKKTESAARSTRQSGLMATRDDVHAYTRRYEETFSDLVALRFIRINHPGQYSRVRDHLVKLRKAHGYHDPEHDSSLFLTDENVARIADTLDAKVR